MKTFKLNKLLGVVVHTLLLESALLEISAAPLTVPPQDSVTSHAVIIGLDGVGADQMRLHLNKGLLPNIARLRREGSFKEDVRAVSPTDSLPNWMAALSAGPVEFTGITSNDWGRNVNNALTSVGGLCDYFPTIFQVVASLDNKKKRQQQETQDGLLKGHAPQADAIPDMAAWFGWPKFNDILRPKAYFQEMVQVLEDHDQDVVDHVIGYWRLHRPRLSFVYLGAVDSAGHGYGYGDQYTRVLIEADRHIGLLLQTLEDVGMLPTTTVAVVSDHGRKADGHGHGATNNLESITQMFLWGPSIQRGHNITSAVSILDTSPTILASLGLGPGPSQWRGRPLLEAFLPESQGWHAAAAAALTEAVNENAQSPQNWVYIEERPDKDDPCRIALEQGSLLPPQRSFPEKVAQFLFAHFDNVYVRGLLSGILLMLILGVCATGFFCGRGCLYRYLRKKNGWTQLPPAPRTTNPAYAVHSP